MLNDQALTNKVLTKQDTALLIVDVQGKLSEQMHNSAELFNNIAVLIQVAKLFELPIVWVEQLPEKLGNTHPDIAKHLAGKALEKSTFSACGNAKILAEIERVNRDNWIVAGLECHVCVYQSVRDLLNMGKKIQLVTDAVSSRTLSNKEIGLQAMKAAGASLTSTEMVIFELQQKAEGDVFRQMIKLIK